MEKKKVVLLSMYWSSDTKEMLGSKHYFRELQPWIQETINLFKNKDDVELHVVAPNFASNTDVETIKDGIYFHFFNYAPSFLCACVYPAVRLLVKHDEPHKVAERTVNLFTDFSLPKKKIPAIINRIKPDLIHLYGSENPDYSVGILPFLKSKTPVLLSVQGYAYLLKRSTNCFLNRNARYRIKYERIINSQVRYITNYGLDYGFEPFDNGQKKYVLSAITKIPPYDCLQSEIKYDVVFYARINKDKGIEDLIQAISYLKKQGRCLRTIVVGRAVEEYKKYLDSLIEKEDVSDLIEFTGFLDNHDDVYKIAASSKVLAFPSHNDVSPNTIRESMFMHLPIVAYRVGGVPYFNVHKECIDLVNDGDIESFANELVRIIDDNNYRNLLIDNAYKEAQDYYNPESIYNQAINIYKDIWKNEESFS